MKRKRACIAFKYDDLKFICKMKRKWKHPLQLLMLHLGYREVYEYVVEF